MIYAAGSYFYTVEIVEEQHNISVPFEAWGLNLENPLIIAGPCSAESEEQVLETARAVAKNPQVKVFRAGVWKPRTRPDHFEGAGVGSLPWLGQVKAETGLLTTTEVANATHVEECLKEGIDMLWIGARTIPNPFAVQEIADALRGVDMPVFVKNPLNPDLNLWIGAIERLAKVGITRIAAIHRGFSWFGERDLRNAPMWEFPVRLKARMPEVEVICDPSHIAGQRSRVAEISQKAMDLNMDGLMIEVHRDPDNALSDAAQQLTPNSLHDLLANLKIRESAVPEALRTQLDELRQMIDGVDEEIAQKLAARAELVDRIGQYKFEHNVAIPQQARFDEILKLQRELASALGINEDHMEEVMHVIHKESIRRQTEIWKSLETNS